MDHTHFEQKQSNDVKNKVQTTSLDTLQDSIRALENTSGGQSSKVDVEAILNGYLRKDNMDVFVTGSNRILLHGYFLRSYVNIK